MHPVALSLPLVARIRYVVAAAHATMMAHDPIESVLVSRTPRLVVLRLRVLSDTLYVITLKFVYHEVVKGKYQGKRDSFAVLHEAEATIASDSICLETF